MRPPAELSLSIGGFIPFSTVDYPGKIAAVVFCQGCPWRCRYCHNPHLQPFLTAAPAWRTIEERLTARRGFLDAVVFSGGEPTAQADLGLALHRVRRLGYAAGLHTAGIFPERFAAVLPLVDWVGFDVKAPFDAYEHTTGVSDSGAAAAASLEILLHSRVDYELRTTVHPLLLDENSRRRLTEQLRVRGAPLPRWQSFRPIGCADAELSASLPAPATSPRIPP